MQWLESARDFAKEIVTLPHTRQKLWCDQKLLVAIVLACITPSSPINPSLFVRIERLQTFVECLAIRTGERTGWTDGEMAASELILSLNFKLLDTTH